MNFEFLDCYGKTLGLSDHARERFIARWNAINDCREYTDYEKGKYKYFSPKCQKMMASTDARDIDMAIILLYNNATPVRRSRMSRTAKERASQYSANTKILRNYPFEFVVSDDVIATIEICASELRWMNDVQERPKNEKTETA